MVKAKSYFQSPEQKVRQEPVNKDSKEGFDNINHILIKEEESVKVSEHDLNEKEDKCSDELKDKINDLLHFDEDEDES